MAVSVATADIILFVMRAPRALHSPTGSVRRSVGAWWRGVTRSNAMWSQQLQKRILLILVFADHDYEFLQAMGSDINAPGVGVGLLLCYNKSTGRGQRARTLSEQMVWSGRDLRMIYVFPPKSDRSKISVFWEQHRHELPTVVVNFQRPSL